MKFNRFLFLFVLFVGAFGTSSIFANIIPVPDNVSRVVVAADNFVLIRAFSVDGGADSILPTPQNSFFIDMPIGVHTLTLKATGCNDFSVTRNWPSGGGHPILNVTFTPLVVNVTVYPTPADAQVYINDVLKPPVGVANHVIIPLNYGTHTLKVKKYGYADHVSTLHADQDKIVNITLNQIIYNLTINVNVAGSQIQVNDMILPANTNSVALPYGTYTIKVTKNRYFDFTSTISLNQNMTINVTLLHKVTFQLIIRPHIEGTQIYLNNILVPTTSTYKFVMIECAPGSNRIRVVAPGYQIYDKTINAVDSKIVEVRLIKSLTSIVFTYPIRPGLKITVDGTPVALTNTGTTTVVVSAGNHIIRATFGAMVVQRSITIAHTDTARLTVGLAITDTIPTPEPEPEPIPSPNHTPSS